MKIRRAVIELALLAGLTAVLLYTPLFSMVTGWFADRATDSIVEVLPTTTTTTTTSVPTP